jgi:Spy/CpxP family protein refolding chaperone
VKRFAAGVFLISLASASAAQGIADGKWWKRPRIAQELQLSRDQAAELEKIFARSKPKLIDLRAELEKKQFDYDQAMLDEKADRKAIETKIEVREQARAALQKELSLMELDMKQVLKPDQREKLMRLRENARLRMQERRRRLREETADEEGVDVRRPPRTRPSPRPNR